MKVGYIECFSGISGDMFLGALVDAGASLERMQEAIHSLHVGAELKVTAAMRSGIRATKISVQVDGQDAEKTASSDGHSHHDHEHHSHDHEHHHHHHHHEQPHPHDPLSAVEPATHSHEHRSLSAILELIRSASLAPRAEEIAVRAFRLLAAAESKIHGIPEEEVHFHEVGAVDAIADIVGNAVAIADLGMEKWYCSAINVGSGFVQCAHGQFPVPAPATAELLKGLPTYSAGPKMELVTPTGAALLRAADVQFIERPVLTVDCIGYGAGNRDPHGFPNVVRINLGEISSAPIARERITVLECTIDDQSPEVLAQVLQQSLANGAVDAMLSAVTMKKSRLGTLLTILAPPEKSEALARLLFSETSTLGVRIREEERICLTRHFAHVETPYGAVRVKIGTLDGEPCNFAPEFEDCRALAEKEHVPLKEVMLAALTALRWKEEGIKA